ncbi:MAG TPA: hypothetical protein VHV29_07105 [Terriglobales bacterium]|nr:hypothetical protein [Terriglobales bacterium]
MISSRPHTKVRPSGRFGPNGFYLDTPKNFTDANDYVVTVTISPRLGDGEAKSGRFSHKGKFGQLAAMFAVEPGGMQ